MTSSPSAVRLEWECGRCGTFGTAEPAMAIMHQESEPVQWNELSPVVQIQLVPRLDLGRVDLNCHNCVGDAVDLRRRLNRAESARLQSLRDISDALVGDHRGRAGPDRREQRVNYDIQNLEAHQRGLGPGVKARPWTLVITMQVNGSDRLGEILTDVERRLAVEDDLRAKVAAMRDRPIASFDGYTGRDALDQVLALFDGGN